MKAAAWKKIILKQCEDAGTMHPSFISVIDTLSTVLEQRDDTYKQFVDEGKHIVVERVSDRGAVNSAKNPLYVAWYELNKQALDFWRELGLTTKSYKSMNETIVEKKSKLAEILEKMEK